MQQIDRDLDGTVIRAAEPVGNRVGKAVRAEVIVIGSVRDVRAVVCDCPVIRLHDGRYRQGVAVGIEVVCQDVYRQGGILVGNGRVFDGAGAVVDSDADGGGVCPALPVGGGVGEAVGAVVPGIRCVGDRVVGIDYGCAVRRIGCRYYIEGAAFSVAVVGEHVDGDA